MTVLGRIQHHDERSRAHAVRGEPIIGCSVRHRMGAPNLDQFYTSGCVGFSGGNALNCAAAVRSRRVFNRPKALRNKACYLDNNDGLHNYAKATERDPFDWVYPPTDEGSSVLGLMKYWNEIGVITGYEWAFTFDQFLAALQRQPVLVGTNWYEGMSDIGDLPIAKVSGQPQGGHEYLANQIIWKAQLIGFENSWGENWGMKGRFFIRFDDVRDLLADGGDVAVPRFL